LEKIIFKEAMRSIYSKNNWRGKNMGMQNPFDHAFDGPNGD